MMDQERREHSEQQLWHGFTQWKWQRVPVVFGIPGFTQLGQAHRLSVVIDIQYYQMDDIIIHVCILIYMYDIVQDTSLSSPQSSVSLWEGKHKEYSQFPNQHSVATLLIISWNLRLRVILQYEDTKFILKCQIANIFGFACHIVCHNSLTLSL